ncbi:CamS family sex pheromone protein [Saliterribacillus persicus]|uniref:Protein involved in sex pheromone biosynthesis n=1 Tax=Saliterribacillus persicus TaxID=930114 RepID=A0A368XD78_9BACI|nr:CamS family sex pheromone protein [Saliterribacillus persicus]RCW65795.1 protein involved in sex pheromone biosynthesis [Saliterribacillus persicus]
MKKIVVILLAFVLLITGCAPSFSDQDEAIVDESQEEIAEETAIIPRYSVSDTEYRVLIDNELSKARGVITNQIANRIDIDEVEEGLKRHSKQYYDPDRFYFQEGQYLTEDILYNWLERYDEEEEPLGLNPAIEEEYNKEQEENNPKYLSHVLEQNYVTKSEDNVVELAGISLAIAMKSVYRFQTEKNGPDFYKDISESEMLREANSISQKVVTRVREIEGLEEVPILLSIYREASQSSLTPGSFVAKTTVGAEENSVGDWESIDEEYVLFPSNYAQENYPDTWANLNDFESDISTYFPNYVSVIGKGFYKDGELRRLTIEIPVAFYGKSELIGFTQYVYGLVVEGFQNHYDLEINIKNGDKQESLIVREAGDDEGFVHIYR